MSSPPAVSVCICTFRRPAGLEALLRALAAQQQVDAFQIVIVENEPDGPASGVIAAVRGDMLPHWIAHDVEPRQNIALARNRTVALAEGEFIAFVDDDEVPGVLWLRHLLQAQSTFDADAVFGTVLPSLPQAVPAWIERGGFFGGPRHKTGTVVPVGQAATSNALVRRSWLLNRPGPFMADFGRSGGEDTVLFEDLRDAGARYVWCDEAFVHDTVPLARCTLSWLLKRAFRAGVVYNRQQIRRSGRARGIRLALAGAMRALVALPMAVMSLVRGRHASVWWLRKASAGVGRLFALSSFRVKQYSDEMPDASWPATKQQLH